SRLMRSAFWFVLRTSLPMARSIHGKRKRRQPVSTARRPIRVQRSEIRHLFVPAASASSGSETNRIGGNSRNSRKTFFRTFNHGYTQMHTDEEETFRAVEEHAPAVGFIRVNPCPSVVGFDPYRN